MKKYVGIYKDLGLDEEFKNKAKEQLVKIDKEVPFKKEEEKKKRKLEEEKAEKKKKKKKK